MDPLKLTLTTKVQPVVLAMPDGTTQVDAEVFEMVAAERDRYLDKLTSRMRLDTNGQPQGVKKFEGLQSELLSRCLRKANGGGVFTEAEIQTWPASAVTQLFQAAQRINRLGNMDGEKTEKND